MMDEVGQMTHVLLITDRDLLVKAYILLLITIEEGRNFMFLNEPVVVLLETECDQPTDRTGL